MDFKLHAPYKPTGDQPEAIRQLLAGLEQGYNDQVLLGATGTGKSLGWDEPVYLVTDDGQRLTPRLEPIGAVLDAAFAAAPDVRQVGDSQVLDLPAGPTRLLAQAIDPATLEVGLHPIQSFTRHAAPAEMFGLTTTCGRRVVLTGDHNLWVVRDGALRLIATRQARRGDLIPAPTTLLGVPAAAPVAQDDLELAHLYGVYLAAAAWEADCVVFTLPDAGRAARLGDVCAALGLAFSRPALTQVALSDPAAAARLGAALGREAGDRHLPAAWPEFPPQQLAALLTPFFDLRLQYGASAEIFVRTGDRLAADLLYALLRLGLWATALAAPTRGETYVRLQGHDELRRFQATFSLRGEDHRSAWASLFKANRPPLPPPGERVPLASSELARLQLEVSGSAARPVAVVSASLTSRSRLRNALDGLAGQRLRLGPAAGRLPADWEARWEHLDRLANLHWLEVQDIQAVAYPHPYVYDLTVPGVETFLAGHGGMFVHNTFTMASIIEQMRLPTLVMAHNKTLAAQLYAEFKEFFPENAVEYFVSYYDYYQPEAYVPRQDLYIEKDSDINEEIERLRLAATTALMSRRDTIVVASVSCIYGIGNPEAYGRMVVNLESGNVYRRNALLRQLVEGQYERNDLELKPGTFRVRGDSLDILPAYSERVGMRITFFGDEVERILEFDTVTGELKRELKTGVIYPAKHFITDSDKLRQAIADIEAEAAARVAELRAADKLLEAQRLEQRTTYDLEMLREVGYCSGIENYSRHLDQRPPGSPPWTLMDYLPSDYLLVIDESHMTIPQVRGMFNGDQARKATLVEYGFRLPSAMDNRPLTFAEFEERMGRTIYTSATPGPYERAHADQIVEQIIRPTGLVDPEVEIRPIEGQVDDLVGEIRQRTERGERVLVTTLTKRMAEKLSEYLLELGIKVHYLHSEVETLERIGILRDLRLGVFDVIVGINLLREGLDLPEVSLVAILDADKEGFLRSDTALIQTIGRAARHVHGKVIMYADVITASMQRALDETNHRRTVQQAYNEKHGIEPISIFKAVRDLTDQLTLKPGSEPAPSSGRGTLANLPKNELQHLIQELEKQMKAAARALEFEKAAALRDQVFELRAILVEETNAPPWARARLLAERDEPES